MSSEADLNMGEEAVDYGEGEALATGKEDGGAADVATGGDHEIAELQKMLDEMEQNQTKIVEASSAAAAQASSAVAAKSKADEEKQARDERSVFVGNVDFASTGEELMGYFSSCGTIERVTILADRNGQPKGFAYIEFADKSAVDNALILNNTEFRGRQLKIMQKRTNMPSFLMRGGGGGRGAPRGGRGRGGGGFYGGGHYTPRGAAFAAGGHFAPRGGRGGYHPRGGFYQPRGGAPRGRGRGGYY